MQKFLRFFMLVALFLPFALQAQNNTLTVCDGTASDEYVPMYGYYADANQHNQMIYPAEMLADMEGQAILQMVFHIDPNASNGTYTAADRLGTWTVSLGETTDTALSGLDNTTTLTQVYQGYFDCSTGTLTLEFETPYVYNGGNLLVDLNHAAASWNHWFFLGVVKTGAAYTYSSVRNFLPKCTFTYGTPPSCLKITNLTVGAATTTDITLNWIDALNDGASYNIYNMSDSSLIYAGVDETTYTISDLEANTPYIFGVETDCGEGGLADGLVTISARTACEANIDFPWTENFESYPANTGYSYSSTYALNAPCWTNEHISGAGSYLFEVSSYNTTGNNTKQLRLPDMSSGTMTMLKLPLMDIPEGSNYLFSLDVFRNASGTSATAEGVRVYASTTGDIVGASELGFISRNYTQTDGNVVAAEAASGWYTYNFLIPFTGEGYIILRGESQYGSATYLDNFVVAEAPSCLAVTALHIDTTTAHSITFSWSDDGNDDATYVIYAITANDTTEIDDAIIEDNTATIEELTANTSYTFGVMADCNGDPAAMTLVSGRTDCDVITYLPWTDDMETAPSGSYQMPFCWRRYNNLASGYNYFPYNYNSDYYAHESDRSLYWYYGTSSTYADTAVAILPELDVTNYPMANNQLSFYGYAPSSSVNVIIGTMSDPEDISTFVPSGTVTVAGEYQRYDVNLTEAGEEDAYAAIMVLNPNEYAALYIDDVTLHEAPSCNYITNLTITDFTTESISLSWSDANNESATYSIYNGTEFVANVPDTFYTVEDLEPTTLYTLGVVANCDGGDAEMITINGHTACSTLLLDTENPFIESFELSSPTTTCWNFISMNSANDLGTTNGMGFVTLSGKRVWRFSSYYEASSDNYNQYAYSPIWEVPSDAGSLNVKIRYATYNSSNELYFGYITEDDTVWSNAYTTTGQNDFQYYEVPVPATATQLAIRYYGDYSWYAWIDSVIVTVSTAEPCFAINNLNISGVTNNSIDVNWESDVNMYDIEVLLGDSLIYSETVYENAVTIEDLEADMNYTVRVRSNCGDDNVSTWTTNNAYTGYCLPNPTSCDGSGITNVSFGGMTNTTHPTTAPFYGNYVSMAGSVPAGTPATVEITYATGYTYGTLIWVDWNNNMIFEGNEVVYAGESSNASPTTLTATFDIPATIEEGNYRMRIAGADSYFDNYTSSLTAAANANPCFSAIYSIAEDYTLTVTEAPNCLAITNLTVDSVTATSVFLSWADELNSGATYTIYNMSDTSVIESGVSGLEYEVEDLESTTAYTFGVVANCSSTDFSLFTTVNATTDCANGSCEITITGTDQYNDSWNLAYIKVMQAGIEIGTFDVPSGQSPYTATFSVCSGAPVSFVWVDGNYDSECNFTIYDGASTLAYTGNGSSLAGTFFTLADACPTCIAPAVTVDTTTETAITISWTGEAESFDIYQDGEFVESTTANTYTFNGLNPSSSYVLGVQAICSETDSSVMTTVNAATDCADITSLPYHEGFENGLGCWTTVNGSADGRPWNAQGPFGTGGSITAHTGSYMASSWSWNSSAMHANAWLISPKFVLPTATDDNLTLSWWHRVSSNYPHELYDVMISTTTNDTAAFATTLLAVSPDSTSEWIHNTINLTAYAGQEVYLAFHHHDSYDQNYLLLDDIELFQGGYVPPAPDTLTVTFAVNDATMGTTIPAPGTYQYIAGDTVLYGAQANDGYHFAMWVISYDDGSIDTLSNYYNYNRFLVSNMLDYDVHSMTMTAYFETGLPDSTTITYAVNDVTMGTTNPAPGTHVIYVDDPIIVTAIPNEGYMLSAWTIDYLIENEVVESDTINIGDQYFANPMTIFEHLNQMYVDYGVTFVITAIFEAGSVPTQYTVTLNTANATMGTVSPAGTTTVNEGASFTATATAAEGYHFVAWMNGATQVSTANPYTFNVTENITLTATFEANDPVVTYYEVTVNSADLNKGTVTSTASGQVAENTEVTVTATPAEGYHFVAWMNGDAQVSTANPYTFNVTENITLTATFEANDPVVTYYEVTVNSADLNMGTVTSTASGQVAENTEVTVTATPAEGYRFVAWMNGNDTVSTVNPYTFTVTGDITLTAIFDYEIGIDDFDFTNVNVYSTKSTIIVNGAENQDIFVYDMNGRCIYKHFNANETERINVLSAGAYLVRISNGVTKKVVVVK